MNNAKLNRITRMAGKIKGSKQKSVDQLYGIAVKRKALALTGDITHPLNYAFELLPSGRSYRTPNATKAIYKQIVVPNAVGLLNKGYEYELFYYVFLFYYFCYVSL